MIQLTAPNMEKNSTWIEASDTTPDCHYPKEGVASFVCRRCGACCRIKDGIVRVSEEEIARIAAFLGMTESDFVEAETEVAPDRTGLILKSRPDGACVYLRDDNLCQINPVKPDKCRTFPLEWTNPDSKDVCPAL